MHASSGWSSSTGRTVSETGEAGAAATGSVAKPVPPTAPSDSLYDDLAKDLRGRAARVIVGLNWTLVEGPRGIGLAHTPPRGTEGCRTLPAPGDYAGRSLAALAELRGSANVFERSIGHAAVNAHHNVRDIEGGAENGLDLIQGSGRGTVVIGRFPELERRLPEAAVIERDPGPHDYPEEAAETLLPRARQVVITASALVNGTLPRLLELAAPAFVVLVGPSAPLAPVLFDHGIDALSGLVAVDVEAMARAALEGGAVRALKRHGRYVTLRRS